MCSAGPVTTAPVGSGESIIAGDEDYRMILPTLPSGESMKNAVVLHGDIACRPYRIEDFRQPLGEAGVLGEVAKIGSFQMSHVWLLDLKTYAAKQKLLAGRLAVKGRRCVVVNPYRQEIRIKLHWVSFGVTNDTIQRAFYDYGEVKELAYEKWKVSGFDGVESTTRTVRLVLREGVSLERLPHQLRLGGGMVLVVVSGRAPVCLRCRRTGHIRRECRAPWCSECRAVGHERADCVRTYARAAGRGAGDDNADHLMDEEEAEKVAAPMEPTTERAKDGEPGTVPEASATSSGNDEAGKAPAPDSDPTGPEMDVVEGSAKRLFVDDTESSRDRWLRQLEHKWRLVEGRRGKDDSCSNEAHCVNCSDPHPAYSRSCKTWKEEKEVLNLKVKENLSYPEARRRFAFLRKGGYAQVVQRGPAPLKVAVATQTSFLDYGKPRQSPTPQLKIQLPGHAISAGRSTDPPSQSANPRTPTGQQPVSSQAVSQTQDGSVAAATVPPLRSPSREKGRHSRPHSLERASSRERHGSRAAPAAPKGQERVPENRPPWYPILPIPSMLLKMIQNRVQRMHLGQIQSRVQFPRTSPRPQLP
ncbi:uncharacterized protein ISCGN_009179 [Ixodes scapularis]